MTISLGTAAESNFHDGRDILSCRRKVAGWLASGASLRLSGRDSELVGSGVAALRAERETDERGDQLLRSNTIQQRRVPRC